MKKIRAIFIVLICAILTAGLCACGGGDEPCSQGHDFSLEWEFNETHHWHEATCEHTELRSEEAEHSYVDGECVCGKTEPVPPHQHTYSDAWTKNETHHWHEATCGHSATKDTAEHEFGSDFVCDICGYEHEHTYSSEWESDGSKHWRNSLCHVGYVLEEAEHSYDNDYVCSVCKYVHEHTFSDKWSYDEENHWHAATCGHDVKSGEAVHFIGGDNACVDNCGYEYKNVHEHTYSTKWTYDEENHWHAATCEHKGEKEYLEEHIFGNDDTCNICGYTAPIIIMQTDITNNGWAYGNVKTNAKRIRVNRLIHVKVGTVIKYNANDLKIYLDLADGEGATTGERVGWLQGTGEYVVQKEAYLGITIAYPDGNTAISPTDYKCDITIFPGTGVLERTYEKRNVYKFGGEGNDWCFVYLPEGYDPDRAEPYPFVIANHGNGWSMNGSAQTANWTNIGMYMSAEEIAKQPEKNRSRYVATSDENLWYSNATIEAFLEAGYIVAGAQNYADGLYGNDNCTDACVDFFNHIQETYNVKEYCYMIGASNGAMTTLNAAAKLGDKVKSIILQYPLASIISQYEAGGHRDGIAAAYGLDASKTYTRAELEELIGEYDPLYNNVIDGVKQGYFPSVKIYYSLSDTTTKAEANALPLIAMLEKSGIEHEGVRVDSDGVTKPHGHIDHFDPEGYVEWFNLH